MKKIVLTLACALATGAALADGNVNWGSISFAAMTAQTDTGYSPLFGGNGVGTSAATSTTADSFYYELLYTSYSGTQATVTSLSGLLSWSDAGLEAVNASSAGRLTPIDANSGATVPWSPGTTDSIVLVGWSSNLGSDWATVSGELANWNADASGIDGAAYFGVSTTGYITTLSDSTSPGAAVFGTGPTGQGLPIKSLNTQLYTLPVPEPATIALAGLSGLSLLFFRRRNNKV